MDCQETLQHLTLLLDGELDEHKEQQILGHIQDCWHCAEVRENEEKLKQLIKEKLTYKLTTPSSVTESIKNIIYTD